MIALPSHPSNCTCQLCTIIWWLINEVGRLRDENDAWQDAMLDLTERYEQLQSELAGRVGLHEKS